MQCQRISYQRSENAYFLGFPVRGDILLNLLDPQWPAYIEIILVYSEHHDYGDKEAVDHEEPEDHLVPQLHQTLFDIFLFMKGSSNQHLAITKRHLTTLYTEPSAANFFLRNYE